MAEQRAGRSDIRGDEGVDRAVPDPSHPDVSTLSGFVLARSDREDYWRLYLNDRLNHYFEFRKEDTLEARQIRPTRTLVWVRPGTRVHETTTVSAPVDFLLGDVRRGFFRGIGGLALMMADSEGCPGSGCAHCSVACSNLPDPGA